eukprot:272520_1
MVISVHYQHQPLRQLRSRPDKKMTLTATNQFWGSPVLEIEDAATTIEDASSTASSGESATASTTAHDDDDDDDFMEVIILPPAPRAPLHRPIHSGGSQGLRSSHRRRPRRRRWIRQRRRVVSLSAAEETTEPRVVAVGVGRSHPTGIGP